MVIRWNGKNFRVIVKERYVTRFKVAYDVIGRNKTVVVESNKPLLENKGLDNWVPTYTVKGTSFNTSGFEKALIETLHRNISLIDQQTKGKKWKD